MNSTTPARELTPRQQSVLDFIQRHVTENGYPPTVRDIGAEFGLTSPNGVLCHLKALRRKGRLDWKPHVSRTMRVLRPGQRPGMVRPVLPYAGEIG